MSHTAAPVLLRQQGSRAAGQQGSRARGRFSCPYPFIKNSHDILQRDCQNSWCRGRFSCPYVFFMVRRRSSRATRRRVHAGPPASCRRSSRATRQHDSTAMRSRTGPPSRRNLRERFLSRCTAYVYVYISIKTKRHNPFINIVCIR